MEIKSFKVSFEHKGTTYNFRISWPDTIYLPTDFSVNDERNYCRGQLLYYAKEDRWRFYHNNGDNNQELADILGNYVVLWYE